MNKHEEIELREIFTIIKRKIVVILAISAISAVAVFGYTKIFVKKRYVSEGMLIVNNRKDDSSSITNDEINSAKGLTAVYSIVIKSDAIMETVIRNLDLDIKPETLRSYISVSSVNATQVMRISAKTKSAKLSAEIVNEILELAPDEIVDKVEAGSVKIISEAKVKPKAVSPSALRNTVLIFVVSLFGTSALFIIIDLLDKSIRSEQDIEKYLGVPLLGVIPNVDSVRGHAK